MRVVPDINVIVPNLDWRNQDLAFEFISKMSDSLSCFAAYRMALAWSDSYEALFWESNPWRQGTAARIYGINLLSRKMQEMHVVFQDVSGSVDLTPRIGPRIVGEVDRAPDVLSLLRAVLGEVPVCLWSDPNDFFDDEGRPVSKIKAFSSGDIGAVINATIDVLGGRQDEVIRFIFDHIAFIELNSGQVDFLKSIMSAFASEFSRESGRSILCEVEMSCEFISSFIENKHKRREIAKAVGRRMCMNSGQARGDGSLQDEEVRDECRMRCSLSNRIHYELREGNTLFLKKIYLEGAHDDGL
jgi:hypothetical protein